MSWCQIVQIFTLGRLTTRAVWIVVLATGLLLPTVSNKVRHNHEEIEDYFVDFLAKGPSGKIDESNVRIYGDLAINSGVYTFTFKDGTVVQARFTFVYRWSGQRWLIVEHHSSRMPE